MQIRTHKLDTFWSLRIIMKFMVEKLLVDCFTHTGLCRRLMWFCCWVLDWIGCCTLGMHQDSMIMFRSYRYRVVTNKNMYISVICYLLHVVK